MLEYLYKCPKCGAEHWDTMYLTPICVHGFVAYETRPVYQPGDSEEVSGIRVTREKRNG